MTGKNYLSHATYIAIFTVLAVVILYYARLFLIPIGFAILLSMLLLPVSNWLENKGVGRIAATLLCILLVIVTIALILLIIAAQAANLSEQWPQIQGKLQEMVTQVQQWVQQQFGVAPQEQIKFVQEQIQKFSQSANQFGTSLLKGSLGLITSFALVLLYMFFLLWKREKYHQFFLKLFSAEHQDNVRVALREITEVAGQYLAGRLFSILFITAFYAIGFSIIGLENALLVAPIAALPILVPYIGAFVGSIFPLVMALVSGSTGMVVPTVAVMLVAQAIDNNIIEPLVMGAKLNLSPFFTIVAVVSGELVWGVAGMILFEPLFAVIRIVCGHVRGLHPYAYLLENEVAEPNWVKKLKNLFSKGTS
ncbi:AI-2E family transporter [Rufibacter immobilis]|uniref:AI-2E family transporter n=1 Tax=Rufibacter immobilis TaxID=1348778 RepID=A0A3M9MRN8_9BACT|nr:AI-2E family transporter [Rufibacter immobilis]RNI28176.1 AI-2E family transporter [Rufibacter immobilis]